MKIVVLSLYFNVYIIKDYTRLLSYYLRFRCIHYLKYDDSQKKTSGDQTDFVFLRDIINILNVGNIYMSKIYLI